VIRPRTINIEADKSLILEFHCQTNFASDSPWARKISYEHYREKWFSTSQPEDFYTYLTETIQDRKTIAELWIDEETNQVVGYVWVVFHEVEEYGLSIAEINDLLVAPVFQGRGIGLQMLQYVEEKATEQGANLIRSETGIENRPSQRLHEKFGFHTYRILFEKKLD